MFKKHFKCSAAASSEFSNFDVLRFKIIYAIYKLQECYRPFPTPNAGLPFEMLSHVVLSYNKAVITGHF